MRTRLPLLLVVLLGSSCFLNSRPPHPPRPPLPEPWTHLHEKCSDASDCDAGQQCLEWTGTLGLRRTCEIECSIENQWSKEPPLPPCPEPLKCTLFLDAPTVCWYPGDPGPEYW